MRVVAEVPSADSGHEPRVAAGDPSERGREPQRRQAVGAALLVDAVDDLAGQRRRRTGGGRDRETKDQNADQGSSHRGVVATAFRSRKPQSLLPAPKLPKRPGGYPPKVRGLPPLRQ